MKLLDSCALGFSQYLSWLINDFWILRDENEATNVCDECEQLRSRSANCNRRYLRKIYRLQLATICFDRNKLLLNTMHGHGTSVKRWIDASVQPLVKCILVFCSERRAIEGHATSRSG